MTASWLLSDWIRFVTLPIKVHMEQIITMEFLIHNLKRYNYFSRNVYLSYWMTIQKLTII